MAVKLAPITRQQYLASNAPLSGGKLFTYASGSTTKQATYTTSVGDVANSNPIILDTLGRTPFGVWQTNGLNYKYVLAPSTDTDPPTSPIFTEDVVAGINDTSSSFSQWAASGLTPTYINATNFSLVGDQTVAFHVGRRLQLLTTAGTVYGQVTVSAYTTLTTITVVLDSGVLDSGLSTVNLGILTATQMSVPLAQIIHTATNKVTPVAADEFPIWDSVTGILNRLTLANFKALVAASWTAFNQSGGTVNATTGSFSGTITSTVSDSTALLSNSTVTTSRKYISITNTGSVILYGLEGSVGGSLIGGTAAYEAVFRSAAGFSYSVNDGVSVAMRLTSTALAANVGITSSSPTAGIGYATGSGESVTQGTSQTTTVASTRINGLIIMFPGGYASFSQTSFTLTNPNLGGFGDVMDVSFWTGHPALIVKVTSIGIQTCQVTVANISNAAVLQCLYSLHLQSGKGLDRKSVV